MNVALTQERPCRLYLHLPSVGISDTITSGLVESSATVWHYSAYLTACSFCVMEILFEHTHQIWTTHTCECNAPSQPCSWHGAGWLLIAVFVTPASPPWQHGLTGHHTMVLQIWTYHLIILFGGRVGQGRGSWLPSQDECWLREEISWRRPQFPDKCSALGRIIWLLNLCIWNHLPLINLFFTQLQVYMSPF